MVVDVDFACALGCTTNNDVVVTVASLEVLQNVSPFVGVEMRERDR